MRGLVRASTSYFVRGRTKDVDGPVKPGHDGADVASDAGGIDLPVVSSPVVKRFSLFRLVEAAEDLPSCARQEGVTLGSSLKPRKIGKTRYI
jgi:hypothetical protein